ncbi:MAG: transposase [Dysgonamonadaceae bacterium]|nr:transposase [Dysgonamonadaceae bacterium]
MDSADLIREFPGEASRKAKFKAFREQAGVACPKCGSRGHYRKSDKEMYECKHASIAATARA